MRVFEVDKVVKLEGLDTSRLSDFFRSFTDANVLKTARQIVPSPRTSAFTHENQQLTFIHLSFSRQAFIYYPMPVYIRKVTPADEPAVSRICLLTADAGKSAEPLFVNLPPEVPGTVYAVPYLHLKSCWGFVLADSGDSNTTAGETADGSNNTGEKVVGYILGSSDVRAFEADAALNWWPAARERYPLPSKEEESKYNGTELYYLKTINNFPSTGQEVVDVYPAFIHINLLKEYRGAGWGTKFMRTAAEKVMSDGPKGLWVGIDSRNDEARKFYLAIGFTKQESKEGEYYTLDCQKYLDSGRGRSSS